MKRPERARSGTGRRGGAGRPEPRGFLRRRLLPTLSRLLALAALLTLLQFAIGRVLTDRVHATQYLWWIPALWSLLAAWGFWAVSAAAGRVSLRTKGMMLRPIALLGCLTLTGWVLLAEWNMHRLVLRPAQATRDQTLRVLHWNQSGGYRMNDSDDMIERENPDIAVVVNARFDKHRRELVESLGNLAPGDEEIRLDGRVKSFSEPGHLYSSGMALIGSKERILRAGLVALPYVEGADPKWRTANDPGFVVWCEIEPGERFASLGRPIVLWVVDFPSDPSLWRLRVMESALEAIAAWNQPAFVADEAGRWVARGEPTRVPPPDIVMGDFNAIRGSASVAVVTPGMHDAFEEAGWGRARSWRQSRSNPVVNLALRLADWHIDLTRVGSAWRATRYRLIRPASGPHDAQLVELTPASG
jgi:hypothetical protein